MDNDCDGLVDAADPDCAVPSGTVNGTVQDVNLNPIQGAKISLLDINNNLNEVWSGFTDANGQYSASVAPGNYKIVASHPNYVPQFFDITVASGEIISVQFILVSNTFCQADCTYNSDNLIHKECSGVNGCSFIDTIAENSCDLAQYGWQRPYNAINDIICNCEGNCISSDIGPLVNKVTTKATVTCEGENLIKITKIVLYKGEPVNMVITVCG